MKRILSILLVIVVASFLFAPAALAANNDFDKIVAEVNQLNAQIDSKVAKAVEQADKFIAQGKADKVDKVIADLLKWVDNKAENMIKKAAKKGVEVYCEYVPVEIGGQTVMIDPLRIGGL